MKRCLCCGAEHPSRHLYCPPCRAYHPHGLAPKDYALPGATTCPEGQRASLEYAARIAAMPAPTVSSVSRETQLRVADLDPGRAQRGATY